MGLNKALPKTSTAIEPGAPLPGTVGVAQVEKAYLPARDSKPPTDWDSIARGKVACASYAAALASQGVAALPCKTPDQYLANVEMAARKMIEFVWREQKGA